MTQESSEKAKKLRDMPQEASFILLDEIAGRLADITELQTKILTHLQEITPQGVDVKFDDQTVTAITTLDFIKNYPYHPLRSIDFFNKGANTVYYRINEDGKEIPIEDRVQQTAERPRATIKYLTLRVESGTAVMQLIGHY